MQKNNKVFFNPLKSEVLLYTVFTGGRAHPLGWGYELRLALHTAAVVVVLGYSYIAHVVMAWDSSFAAVESSVVPAMCSTVESSLAACLWEEVTAEVVMNVVSSGCIRIPSPESARSQAMALQLHEHRRLLPTRQVVGGNARLLEAERAVGQGKVVLAHILLGETAGACTDRMHPVALACVV